MDFIIDNLFLSNFRNYSSNHLVPVRAPFGNEDRIVQRVILRDVFKSQQVFRACKLGENAHTVELSFAFIDEPPLAFTPRRR